MQRGGAGCQTSPTGSGVSSFSKRLENFNTHNALGLIGLSISKDTKTFFADKQMGYLGAGNMENVHILFIYILLIL